MSTVKITTDHKWKPFTYRYDVPARVLTSQFDYQDANEVSDGFFCYRGTWYHLDMFMRTTNFDGWTGVHGDSYFSGVLIRLSDDGETYQIATFTC